MTNWKLRMTSLLLAATVFCAAPVPALAASADSGKGGWFQTLLEVPVLGDLVRLITGAEKEEGTDETATMESATAETATPENANPLRVTPETAWTSFPASWMQGSVQTGVGYPPDTAQALSAETPAESTVTVQQWASVDLTAGTTLRPANREETNFGDLAADAAANAAAAWLGQQTGEVADGLRGLPVAALVDGASLTGNVAPGTSLTQAAACVDENTVLAMVQVSPKKLYEILTLGLQDMHDSTGENYGGFWQVSGLRGVYQTSDDEARFVEVWLTDAGKAEGVRLDGQDEQSSLLLVLPADMLDRCGVNAEAGYTDYLSSASLTLADAITALPRNVNAETLTAILTRGGSVGRLLPVGAGTYDAVVQLGAAYAGKQISFLLDGTARTAVTDAQGCLTIAGLTAGSHTFAMAAGETAYYLSNLTFVGTADAGSTAVTVASVPASCVQDLPAATPTASPAPAAATPTPQVVTVTSPDDPTPTPVPTPTAPPATATPAPTARATAAPVQDPTAGLLDTTPAPTLAPTPTPSPTPEPTPDPETLEKQEEMRQTSSMLPLYIGIGVVLVGGVTAAVLVLRSRAQDGGRTYRRRRK